MPVPKLFGHTFGQEWGGWSSDGALIATSGTDGSARLWDATTGEQLKEFAQGSYWSDWVPDGTRLVFAEGVAANALSVWDVATEKKLMSLSAPEDAYGAHQFLTMDWSPDGTMIATVFGIGEDNQESLFFTNYAVLPPEPATSPGPAVLKFDVGVPGLPLPWRLEQFNTCFPLSPDGRGDAFTPQTF